MGACKADAAGSCRSYHCTCGSLSTCSKKTLALAYPCRPPHGNTLRCHARLMQLFPCIMPLRTFGSLSSCTCETYAKFSAFSPKKFVAAGKNVHAHSKGRGTWQLPSSCREQCCRVTSQLETASEQQCNLVNTMVNLFPEYGGYGIVQEDRRGVRGGEQCQFRLADGSASSGKIEAQHRNTGMDQCKAPLVQQDGSIGGLRQTRHA